MNSRKWILYYKVVDGGGEGYLICLFTVWYGGVKLYSRELP